MNLNTLIERATAAHQRGDLQDAVKFYRKAIDRAPADAELHRLLAVARYGQGRLAEARTALGKAIRLQPGEAGLHALQARILRDEGLAEESEQAYRTALARDPRHPQAANELGRVLVERGAFDDALAVLEPACRAQPGDRILKTTLALGLLGAGSYERAAEAFESLARERPEDVRLHFGHARALLGCGSAGRALEAVDRGLVLDPDSSEMLLFKGSLLKDYHQLEQAAACYRRILEGSPGHGEALLGLGEILVRSGEIGLAGDCYRELLRQPDVSTTCCTAFYWLAQTAPPALDEPVTRFFTEQEERIEDPAIGALVTNALAQLAQKAGDMEAAERLFVRSAGQTVASGAAREGIETIEQVLGGVEELFTGEQFARWEGQGVDDPLPVFVVGLPRSGSTLIEQVISSHAQVVGLGELPYFNDQVRHFEDVLDTPFPGLMRVLDARQFREIGLQFLSDARALHPHVLRTVDKNLSNHLIVGFLAALFPRARFIHAQRDYLDCGMSAFCKTFAGNYWDFTKDIGAMARYIAAYERLMRFWSGLLGERMLNVNYREMVGRFDETSRAIIRHIGLEWDEACARFYEQKREVQTQSFAQVRQPIYRDAHAKWEGLAGIRARLAEALAGHGVATGESPAKQPEGHVPPGDGPT